MHVENFTELYQYKELFGDDFLLFEDELILTKPEPVAVEPVVELVNHMEHKEEAVVTPPKPVEVVPPKQEVISPARPQEVIETPTEEVTVAPKVTPKHLIKNREGIRDRFVNYYREVIQTNHCPLYRAGRPFIFGAGNLNELDIMVLYNQATENDEKNIKKPMTDASGRNTLMLMKKAGINLKNSYIAPIIKCYPRPGQAELTSIVKEANIKITLNQIDIAAPPIIVIFGLDIGLNLVKSTKENIDLKRDPDEYLHNLRNRLITMRNGHKAIVTYDYHELLHDKTKMHEFVTKDLPFIVRHYKELL